MSSTCPNDKILLLLLFWPCISCSKHGFATMRASISGVSKSPFQWMFGCVKNRVEMILCSGLVMECVCVYVCEREIVDTQGVKTQRIEYAS